MQRGRPQPRSGYWKRVPRRHTRGTWVLQRARAGRVPRLPARAQRVCARRLAWGDLPRASFHTVPRHRPRHAQLHLVPWGVRLGHVAGTNTWICTSWTRASRSDVIGYPSSKEQHRSAKAVVKIDPLPARSQPPRHDGKVLQAGAPARCQPPIAGRLRAFGTAAQAPTGGTCGTFWGPTPEVIFLGLGPPRQTSATRCACLPAFPPSTQEWPSNPAHPTWGSPHGAPPESRVQRGRVYVWPGRRGTSMAACPPHTMTGAALPSGRSPRISVRPAASGRRAARVQWVVTREPRGGSPPPRGHPARRGGGVVGRASVARPPAAVHDQGASRRVGHGLGGVRRGDGARAQS